MFSPKMEEPLLRSPRLAAAKRIRPFSSSIEIEFLIGNSPSIVISLAVISPKISALYLRTISVDSRFQPALRDSAEISRE